MLSPGTVSVRHIALAVLAVLVSGMGVYLFLEVRSSPPEPPTRVAARDPVSPSTGDDRDERADAPTEPVAKADAARSYSAGLRSTARRATGGAATPSTPAPSVADTDGEEKLEGPKLDAVMAEANRAYDKMDFDEARSIAQKVLKQHPDNTRMLRIMTSSYCIENDQAESQKYFNLLPAPDREQMKTRCARYGVTFLEPPAK